MSASMKRRTLLTLCAGAASLVLASYRPAPVTQADRRAGSAGARFADLNPDRMWPVYRRYHLLIVGPRDDERGHAFATAVVDVLGRFLPASRAQLVRAADTRRLGVLIATDQQDVAVMTSEGTEALYLGKPPFEDIRNAPVRIIVSFGTRALVCRPNFKNGHAYMLAKTLAEHKEGLPAPARLPQGAVPPHPGARAYFAGQEMPKD